jgi:hypothetical protein
MPDIALIFATGDSSNVAACQCYSSALVASVSVPFVTISVSILRIQLRTARRLGNVKTFLLTLQSVTHRAFNFKGTTETGKAFIVSTGKRKVQTSLLVRIVAKKQKVTLSP